MRIVPARLLNSVTAHRTCVVRAPGRIRAIGLGLCLLALFGFVVPPLSGGAGAVIGPAWGIVSLWYGVRVFRMAVYADDQAMEVRNRFRTRWVRWSDVADIEYVNRSVPPLGHLTILDRKAGMVRLLSGTNIYLDLTESFRTWLHGRSLSQSLQDGQARTELVLEEWRRHLDSQLRSG